jgi:hypothetical protein
MRIAPIAVLAASLPIISASLAGEAVSWAHSLVSSNPEDVKVKSSEMHTMDSWSWIDCGKYYSTYLSFPLLFYLLFSMIKRKLSFGDMLIVTE